MKKLICLIFLVILIAGCSRRCVESHEETYYDDGHVLFNISILGRSHPVKTASHYVTETVCDKYVWTND